VSARRRPRPIVKPDIDNYIKTIFDACTRSHAVWIDDAQVCVLTTEKQYSDHPGWHVVIEEIE